MSVSVGQARLNRSDAKAAGLTHFQGTTCRRGHDGLRFTCTGNCVQCLSITSKARYARKREQILAQCKEYRENNADEIRERERERYAANPERKLASAKKYAQSEKGRETARRYRAARDPVEPRPIPGRECIGCREWKARDNFTVTSYGGLASRCKACRASKYRQARNENPEVREKWYSSAKDWKERNPEKVRATAAKWTRDRCRADPIYRLQRRMQGRLYKALKHGKGSSSIRHLDYSMPELKDHLERQFTRGMNWDNYGDWHIDHIIPLASFQNPDIGTDEFKRAWSLPNLRPLWAAENLEKKDKVETLL